MAFARHGAAVAGLLLLSGCLATWRSAALPDAVQELRNYHAPLLREGPAPVAAKFQKMQKDIVAFNRGANPLFYRYVESVGLDQAWLGPLGRRVVLHGDCHAENIGAYRSASGEMVVDLLDFDDSFRGPYLLDVYRAASSLYLAARTEVMRERLLEAFVDAYAQTMQKIASGAMPRDPVIAAGTPFLLARELLKEASEPDLRWFYEDFLRTRVENGKRAFVACSDYRPVPAGLAEQLLQSYKERTGYQDYMLQDAVIEHGSGIGSAGNFKLRMIVRAAADVPGDDAVLEFKQEGKPAGAVFAAQAYADQGLRVLEGEKTMQTKTAAHIGSAVGEGKDFYVSAISPYYRELAWKPLVGSRQMGEAAAMMGMLLAKGHARSDAGGHATASEIASLLAGGQKEKFLKHLRLFSQGYSEYLREGYKKFCRRLILSPVLLLYARLPCAA